MSESELTSQIERYLQGQMPDPERLAFEQQMQEDIALAEAIKLEIKARYLAKREGEAALREEMGLWFRENQSSGRFGEKQSGSGFRENQSSGRFGEKQSSGSVGEKQSGSGFRENRRSGRFRENQSRRYVGRLWLYSGVAAVLMVLVLVGIGREYWGRTAISGEELYAQQFELLPFSGNRDANSAQAFWEDGGAAYQEGDYERAIEAFSEALVDSAFDRKNQALLYLGLSLLVLERTEEATAYFVQIEPGSSSHNQGQWYQALAYLKLKKPKEARKGFMQIANDKGHYKQETAREILSKMY